MREESEEVFRGHWQECLERFASDFYTKVPPASKGSAKAREPMAQFCGVSEITVGRWLAGNEAPVGTAYFRLICYLDLMGYRVLELENMAKDRRSFLELLGYSVLTPSEAAKLVGYSKTQTLFAVLRDKEVMSDAKRQIMFDSWQAHKSELEKAKTRARELHRPAVPRQPLTHSEPPRSQHHAVLRLMEGLLILLEGDSFEESLKAELADHPEAARTILLLSSFLSDLSSRLIDTKVRGDG